jgi:hypothetical protein
VFWGEDVLVKSCFGDQIADWGIEKASGRELGVLMKMSNYNFFWFNKIFKTLQEILRYNFVKFIL